MIKLEDRLTIRNKVLEGLKSASLLGNQVRSLRIPSRGKISRESHNEIDEDKDQKLNQSR